MWDQARVDVEKCQKEREALLRMRQEQQAFMGALLHGVAWHGMAWRPTYCLYYVYYYCLLLSTPR